MPIGHLERRSFAILGLVRLVLPRVLLIWIVLSCVLLFAPDPAALLGPSPGVADAATVASPIGAFLRAGAALVNAAVVAAIVVLDIRATREQLMLANLGVGMRLPAALAVIMTLGLELLLYVGESVRTAFVT